MKCSEVKFNLISFINKELSGQENNEIQNHLQMCNDCKNEHDLLIKTYDLLRTAENPEPSEDFLLRLHQKIEQEESKKVSEKLFLRMVIQRVKESFSSSLIETSIKVVSIVLIVLFILGAIIPWSTQETVYAFENWNISKMKNTKEISVSYFFLNISFENEEGRPFLKFRVGSSQDLF